MSYTMEDFKRDYFKEHFAKLTPKEQAEALRALPPEELRELLQSLFSEDRLAGLPLEQRLAGLSAEQIQKYLDQLTAQRPTKPRKPRRKK
jgi:hypothetical protein